MNMNDNNIINNDVNGTPDTECEWSVASGRSRCGQQRIGRHPATDPECGADQATSASSSDRRLEETMTDPDQSKLASRNAKKRISTKYYELPGKSRPFVRYYTIKSCKEADLTKLNLFKVDKEIQRLCGDIARITENNDRTLTIEVKSTEQGEKLLQVKNLVDEPVEVSIHQKYNETQGVITSTLLKNYSESDIADGLSYLGVTKVHRISKKNSSGTLEPTTTLVLTFNVPDLPDKIRIRAGLYERIRPYIPLPRRCFNCQNYGHVTKNCRKQSQICGQCGEECSLTHTPDKCQRPPNCYHCQEPHTTSSKSCTKYQMEKEILALKIKERLTFREARQRVSSLYVRPGITFSAALRNSKDNNNNNNMDINKNTTQTEAINPKHPIENTKTLSRPTSTSNNLDDAGPSTSTGVPDTPATTTTNQPKTIPNKNTESTTQVEDYTADNSMEQSSDNEAPELSGKNNRKRYLSSIETLQKEYSSPDKQWKRYPERPSPPNKSNIKKSRISPPEIPIQDQRRRNSSPGKCKFQVQKGNRYQLLEYMNTTTKSREVTARKTTQNTDNSVNKRNKTQTSRNTESEQNPLPEQRARK